MANIVFKFEDLDFYQINGFQPGKYSSPENPEAS